MVVKLYTRYLMKTNFLNITKLTMPRELKLTKKIFLQLASFRLTI